MVVARDLVGSLFPDAFEPGVYAVVACSAMIAGATHTISPCIIILEITEQVSVLGSWLCAACRWQWCRPPPSLCLC